MPYLEIGLHNHENKFLYNMFVKWGNWILIFTNFVPISLIVSLEMVKYFQGFGMEKDDGTYSEENGIKMTV